MVVHKNCFTTKYLNVEILLLRARLWAGHIIIWRREGRMEKSIIYDELERGVRKQRGQKLRFKDVLHERIKRALKSTTLGKCSQQIELRRENSRKNWKLFHALCEFRGFGNFRPGTVWARNCTEVKIIYKYKMLKNRRFWKSPNYGRIIVMR